MEELLNNWHKYKMLNERVNTLDSGKRFIGNRLQEVTEQYSTIQISDVELNKIRQWGKLTGEPEFLGSGSKGIAYKFNNKVLKITEDIREAEACSLIAGISHPNIYDVYGVARRDEKDKSENLRNMPFVIVYEFLDYPNKLMADVTQIMYHKVRKDDLYYNWKEKNLEIFKKLVKQFFQAVTKDESILGKPIGKYQTNEPKLNAIVQAMGWNEEKQIIFIELWTLIGGMYNSNLNNLQSVADHMDDILNNPKLIYFHQLALGLSFLNKNGIIFTDLKNTNVMEKDGQIAIIDIGKSNVKTSKEIPSL
jgi:serine/threonine protein kinase|tara:strand:+ start:1626 stop:2546 length:921 start_codon:yes stop_codon:yes gene_type:complete